MRHCDPDSLALASLGEPALGADDVAHIADCTQCRGQLTALRGAVLAARGPGDEPPEVRPPARVWAAVAAQTGVRTAPSTFRPQSEPAAPSGPAVVPAVPRSRRPRGIPWYAAAAAAVVAALAGVAVGVGIATDGSGDGPGGRSTDVPGGAAGTVVAVADLVPLEGGPAIRGSARVREGEGDSVRVLEVDVVGLRPATGYYEVWLLDPDGGLLPIGVLTGQPRVGQALPIPRGVDLRTFSVVDVSEEPLDGDPGHSSVSVARGNLALEG